MIEIFTSIFLLIDFLGPILIIAYFVGTIPFGLLLTRIAGYGDIRKIGSGNIGATNVLRTGNKLLALLTLLLDGVKGAIFICIYFYSTQHQFFPEYIPNNLFPGGETGAALTLGFFVILGHCFPVWLKFQGGKGVATTLGVLLVSTPYVGFISCATWLISALFFRISSLAALLAMFVAPMVAFYIYGSLPITSGIFIISALVTIRHHANIRRLLKGDEPKIGKKK